MSRSDWYWPDRSLRLAIVILTGMIVVAASGIYLLAEAADVVPPSARRSTTRMAMEGASRSSTHRQTRRQIGSQRDASVNRRPAALGRSSPLVTPSPCLSGSVPAVAARGIYDLDVDLGNTTLGRPAIGSRRRERTTSSLRLPKSPLAASEGSSLSFDVDLATGTRRPNTWRQGVDDLNRALLALDGALEALEETASPSSMPDSRHRSSVRKSAQGPTPPTAPKPVPLGGGGWLAAAGAAYAVHRLRKRNEGGLDADVQ